MIRFLLSVFLFFAVSVVQAGAERQRILVQSTTSTQNSGFYDYILPIFEREAGYVVDVVAVGTGQAIRNAMNGDADVLLVHARAAEEAFVAENYGMARANLMYNDYVLIGPVEDPAGIGGQSSLKAAMRAMAQSNKPFVSRGDDSGTHKKEKMLWASAGLDPKGSWYRETGSGMGATIRMAVEMGGYTLTDRATWIAFGDKGTHRVLFEGDAKLFNQYGIIVVNPAKYTHVNIKGARAFVDWMLSERGQELIAAYQVKGKQLFFPNGDS